MVDYRTRIETPEIVKQVILVLQGYGHIVEINDTNIILDFEAKNLWDAALDMRDMQHELAANLPGPLVKVDQAIEIEGPPCLSRGPRIGNEGVPVCGRVKGHPMPHHPAEGAGWGREGDLYWYDYEEYSNGDSDKEGRSAPGARST